MLCCSRCPALDRILLASWAARNRASHAWTRENTRHSATEPWSENGASRQRVAPRACEALLEGDIGLRIWATKSSGSPAKAIHLLNVRARLQANSSAMMRV